LIYERVGSPAAGLLANVEAVIRDDPSWHVFYRGGNYIDFVPAAWLSWLPPLGIDRRDIPNSWFVFRLDVRNTRLDFYVEIRRMADVALRLKIVDTLIKEGAKFGFKRSSGAITDYYTRISGRERILEWGDEEEEPSEDAVRSAVKKKLDDILLKVARVPTVLQPLLAHVPTS
jgi:hypothetical protein